VATSKRSKKKTDDSGFGRLGELVRFHRQKSGLSQIDLARLADVGKTALFDLEHGTKQSRLETIERVLSTLNIKVQFVSPLMTAFEESNEKG
jgi:HTH-type transcriptional regulator/antitoxin HipB